MNHSSPRLVCLDLRPDTPIPLQSPPAEAVLCLGNFDGVHRAHHALLKEGLRLAAACSTAGVETAREGGTVCGVFCFLRPSVDFVPHGTDTPPAHLTTLRDKLSRFRAAGVSFAWLCDFRDVRELAPQDFIALLRERCGCVGVACGFNFRFGCRAAGGIDELIAAFGKDRTAVLPEMILDGGTVSASRIRAALLAGDAEGANRLLGRPYSLTATVTGGKQLGRTIGFPTANQYFPAELLIPAHGVYAARCHTPEGVFPGVANVGSHPTVDERARVNCETHILGYAGNLYGSKMRTELLCYLRPEQKFSDIHALTEAIRRDALQAKAYMDRYNTYQP